VHELLPRSPHALLRRRLDLRCRAPRARQAAFDHRSHLTSFDQLAASLGARGVARGAARGRLTWRARSRTGLGMYGSGTYAYLRAAKESCVQRGGEEPHGLPFSCTKNSFKSTTEESTSPGRGAGGARACQSPRAGAHASARRR